MNVTMKRETYEALPFREDVQGDYVYDQEYRVKGEKNAIAIWKAHSGEPALWWHFSVSLY
jgi:hypothetical protein